MHAGRSQRWFHRGLFARFPEKAQEENAYVVHRARSVGRAPAGGATIHPTSAGCARERRMARTRLHAWLKPALIGTLAVAAGAVPTLALSTTASATPGLVAGSTFFVTQRADFPSQRASEGIAKVSVDNSLNVTTSPFVTGVPDNGPDSIVFDAAGELLASNTEAGTISVISPTTGQVIKPQLNTTLITEVADLAIQPGTDYVWAIGYQEANAAGLVKVSLSTGAVTAMDPGHIPPNGIAFSPHGRLFIDRAPKAGAPGVDELDPATGNVIRSASLPGPNDGMTVDPTTGHLWVSCALQRGLCDFDLGTAAAPALTLKAAHLNVTAQNIDGIAADSQGHIYGIERATGSLFQYDIASGTTIHVANVVLADDVAPLAGAGAPPADLPLSANGTSLTGPNPISGVVATFTDGDPAGTVSQYSATIDWGDGSTSAGSISADGNGFDVSGTHSYGALGPYTAHVHICDVGGSCTDARTQILVFAFPDSGAFVVGDQSATGSVTYWGAQWAKVNTLSGGATPAAFKGFADTGSAAVPACGSTWTSRPGNSTPPPGSVPTYLGIIVSSNVSQAGSTMSGDVAHVIVVQTDPGYAGNPGHAGTGTVVGVVC